MESWRKVWREGIVPLLTTQQLKGLRDALYHDDPRLVQENTTIPSPLVSVADWPVEAACVLGYCAAYSLGGFAKEYGDYDYGMTTPSEDNPGAATVGAVEEQFARWCHEIDQRLGEPAGCRWFLNWADETSREVMCKELLPEVDLAIAIKEMAQ